MAPSVARSSSDAEPAPAAQLLALLTEFDRLLMNEHTAIVGFDVSAIHQYALQKEALVKRCEAFAGGKDLETLLGDESDAQSRAQLRQLGSRVKSRMADNQQLMAYSLDCLNRSLNLVRSSPLAQSYNAWGISQQKYRSLLSGKI